MKWIHLFRNGVDRYSSGDVDGWHYQLDARGEPEHKWGGFACPGDSLDGIRVPHECATINDARARLNAALRERGEAVDFEGAASMTVGQLIEALRHMPPDAPVVTHADNHSTRPGDDQRVALTISGRREAVIIGNWSEYNVNQWEAAAVPREVWSVRTSGQRAGLLTRGAMKRHEETRHSVPRTKVVPAQWKFTDETR